VKKSAGSRLENDTNHLARQAKLTGKLASGLAVVPSRWGGVPGSFIQSFQH